VNFLSLLEKKRDGHTLTKKEICELIAEFTVGNVPDYQMAAMLMAIYFRGLDTAETTALTLAMRDSGSKLEFPRDERPLVDKHSTGGIGDKVSLTLVPLLACLGFRVPMISGRGLGITGGTLDKLDSIPGFKTLLSAGKIARQVQKVGCVICGQTDQMVPADKQIYALRDTSGTVPSVSLIVSSILSKKLAENLDSLILDVKFGNAAFMQSKTNARKLANAMVALGNECGVNTRAILTDMNTPVGRSVGNWLEVRESVDCLENRGPEDLRNLILECAAHLLTQTRKSKRFAGARKLAEDCLNSGVPRAKWDEMLVAQGADLKAFNQRLRHDSITPMLLELRTRAAGFVSKCDARIIGEVVRDLGGGRLNKESAINYGVGVDKIAKPGERVGKDSVLARVHASNRLQGQSAILRLKSAFEISANPRKITQLISEIVTGK